MSDDLSPRGAAERIGTTTRTVQRWIASGRLPARRVGSRWRVAIGAIDALAAPWATGGRAGGASAGGDRPTTQPIRTLFIANRGEIVARIARTCERLGIRHVEPAADGPGALDLLDPAAMVSAALAAGADAIHPGFGFLAESADFADLVRAAGLRWVGPPATAIRLMGDKAAARRLARSLGVPVLEGYDDPDQTHHALETAATRIGYPLLIKPAAGGGGKGMRIVREPDRFRDSVNAARREAVAAFADDRLVLERLVENARHVEIQVLFDAHGHGVHLGERDCSIQRRHQKILEETPSPAVGAELRDRLGAAALTLARAVGYVSAGTCEFLLDERGAFTFLEMNTRLQVEHPVTEMVTGRDLVADQLWIAAGEPLGPGPVVAPDGHAVEVRLYAEDAESGFLPAVGRVGSLHWPAGEGVRIDAGIGPGDEITGRFDPMLAKVIAWGQDRRIAFERLAYALDETVVLGVVTNLRFLRWLVRQPIVLDGQARTDSLDRIWPPDDWAASAVIPDAAWAEAARVLAGGPGETDDPWAGGWRLNGGPTIRLEAEDEERHVELATGSPGVTVAGMTAVRVGDVVLLDLAGRSTAIRIAPAPDVDRAARVAVAHGGAAAGPMTVEAPMPGTVLAVHVVSGHAVAIGDPIVTLEAMKMEHAVSATIAGRIGEIAVRTADQVARGQLLAIIEPSLATGES